jgi:sulfur relay (sulfurtransferase) complex TusBCD TusD component (DsrE family)
MTSRPRRLGLVISVAPDHPGFRHAVRLAASALRKGLEVYAYCLDEGVRGVEDQELQALRPAGLRLSACAYAAERRGLPLTEAAVFGGLGLLADILARTDRCLAFGRGGPR